MTDYVLNKNHNKRLLYPDLLRIMAMLAVVLFHVSSSLWSEYETSTYEWNVFNFYNCLVQWKVTIFVMISGTLLLNEKYKITLNKIYLNKIFKLVILWILGGLLYGIYYHFGEYNEIIKEIIFGHYHFWFIPMICGLYMITPFLKKIVKDINLTNYFLILWIITSFAIPFITSIINDDRLFALWNSAEITFTIGYSGYFILGYYLSVRKKQKYDLVISIILWIIGFAASIYTHNYNNFTFPVLFESIGVFLIIKNLDFQFAEFIEKYNLMGVLNVISKTTLGVYIIHIIIFDMVNKFGLTTVSFNSVIAVPLISILVSLVSVFVCFLINVVISYFSKKICFNK